MSVAEDITLALVAALEGIRRTAGYQNDGGRVQRFTTDQRLAEKPTFVLGTSRESGDLAGAGYDVTFEIEIQAHFYHPKTSPKSLDEVCLAWRQDVHRAIAKMDWQTLQVDAVSFETLAFQLQDETSVHDGNVTLLTLTYRLEDSDLETLV